jgi:retron-type reverse transcriptase
LEINKSNVQKVFKLRDNDGELLIHTTLKKHLPNGGLVRLLERSGTKRLLELFHLKPRLLFPLLCRKIGSNEATKLVFNDKKLRHLLDEEYLCRYVSKSVESIRASYNEKPAQALAFDTTLLTSLKDFEFLTYLAWSKSSQWKEGKRFGFFDHLYEEWTIPKKNGDPRKVCSPQARLKRLQHRILERILNKEKVHRNAHGFVPGKSILSNAKPHIKKQVVVNLDLADFFPTTSRQNVFSAFVSIEGISPKTAGFLADICSHKGSLPIGAPTSPFLANLILRSFDKAMTSAARKIGAKYTRYADDLTFSGGEDCIKLIPFAKKLLKEKGYKLNERKINIFRPGRRQVVTGLTVNKKVNVSRAVRKKLRAALHARELGKTPKWSGYPSNDQQLAGLCSFVRSINRKQGNRLQKSLSQKPANRLTENSN